MKKPKSVKLINEELGSLVENSKRRDITSEVREVNLEERSIVHYASTKTADSFETVFLPNCFNLERFQKNPVVLWVHDRWAYPVGKSIWQRSDNNGLLVKTQFVNAEWGDECLMLYKDGFLNGWSVGFKPRNGAWEGSKEFDELVKKWGLTGLFDLVYTEVDLYEYSAVPVPANEDALTAAIKDGKIRSEFMLNSLGERFGLKDFKGLPPRVDSDDDENDEDLANTDDTRSDDEPDDPLPGSFVSREDHESEVLALKNQISELRTTLLDIKRKLAAIENKTDVPPVKRQDVPVIAAEQIMAAVEKGVSGAIRQYSGKLD